MARVHCCNKILDHFNHISDDWTCYIKVKIMNEYRNIFLNKKILVYGLGKSGESTFKYLNSKNHVFLYDDNQLKKIILYLKKNF